jgi:hypothetical protein
MGRNLTPRQLKFIVTYVANALFALITNRQKIIPGF